MLERSLYTLDFITQQSASWTS